MKITKEQYEETVQNLIDILESLEKDDIFNLPISNKKDTNFPKFVKSKLHYYLSLYEKEIKNEIQKLSEVPRLKKSKWDGVVISDEIRQLSSIINQTLKYYYDGNILKAVGHFDEALQKMSSKDLLFKYTISVGKSQPFYRARLASKGSHFNKKELFHPPFNKREVIGANRYSITGFPSLYLGSSTYVCWEETKRKKISKLWFSKFEQKKDINLVILYGLGNFLSLLRTIDSTEKGEKISKFSDFPIDNLLEYIIFYPLIIACNVKTKFSDTSFKAEYIIPQLLLQYILNYEKGSIHGIAYPSTQVDYSKLKNVSAYNYVFPARKIKSNGFCEELSDIFHLTEPTNLEIEELLRSPTTAIIDDAPLEEDEAKRIMLIEGRWDSYMDSSFGKIEKILKEMTTAQVTSKPSDSAVS